LSDFILPFGELFMRRYIYYLAVALIAFGFGSFVALKFHWNTPKIVLIGGQNPFANSNRKKQNDFLGDLRKRAIKDKTEPSQEKIEFACNDAVLATVWAFLLKDKDFKEAAKEVNDCSTIIQIEKIIELNNDGLRDVIVGGRSALVNGASNQGIWLVQNIGKKYKVLLSESAETFAIKKNTTNGFRDIFVKHHMSASSSYDSTYKFSRGKYRESKCLFVDYGITREKKVTTCTEEEAK
jgi:hypothetical protein